MYGAPLKLDTTALPFLKALHTAQHHTSEGLGGVVLATDKWEKNDWQLKLLETDAMLNSKTYASGNRKNLI